MADRFEFRENGGLTNIFDSHCHYDDSAFDADRPQLLAAMMGEGSPVSLLMHAATDIGSSQFGIEMSRRFDGFYTSVGIHPESAGGYQSEQLTILQSLCSERKVRAIGEIGLDYHYEGFDRSTQLKLFEAQLELADKMSMPVIMHCRDALEDFISVLKNARPRGVVHCFTGSAETAEILLDLGLYLGFTGTLTFKNAKKVKKSFAAAPTERILFETDCPYMAPTPYRGKRCTSELIGCIALEGERLSGIAAQQLIDITNKNAKTLFNIEG